MTFQRTLLAGCPAIVALWPAVAWAQASQIPDRYGFGPHMMWEYGGWPMFFFGPLFMILVLAALVAAVVLALRMLGFGPGGGAQPPASSRALDILRERYARGEIDKAEFEERRKILGD